MNLTISLTKKEVTLMELFYDIAYSNVLKIKHKRKILRWDVVQFDSYVEKLKAYQKLIKKVKPDIRFTELPKLK